MIRPEDMPEDNADLAKIDVSFPSLDPDSPSHCPASIDEILAYLRVESPDGDSVNEDQLHFIRTADVYETHYWIWSFVERDGSKCFVTVARRPDDQLIIGYEEDYYGLTPEQFMLGDYHQVF